VSSALERAVIKMKYKLKSRKGKVVKGTIIYKICPKCKRKRSKFTKKNGMFKQVCDVCVSDRKKQHYNTHKPVHTSSIAFGGK